MASPSSKVLKFKIWTGEGGRFLKVHVWQSLSQMRQYAYDRNPHWNGDKIDGCYLGSPYVYDVGRDGKTSPIKNKNLGEIHFWRGRIDPEVVSHEIMHHMISWINHLTLMDGVKDVSDAPHNENLSYQCGRLNRQFWQEYSTHKKELGRAHA